MMKRLSDSRKLTAHACSKWLVAAVGLAAAASLAPLTASAGVVTFENKSAEFRAGVDYTEAGMGYAFFWNFILSPDTGNPPSALVGFPVAIGPFPNAPAGPAIFSTDTTSGRPFTLDGYDIGALEPDRQGGACNSADCCATRNSFPLSTLRPAASRPGSPVWAHSSTGWNSA